MITINRSERGPQKKKKKSDVRHLDYSWKKYETDLFITIKSIYGCKQIEPNHIRINQYPISGGWSTWSKLRNIYYVTILNIYIGGQKSYHSVYITCYIWYYMIPYGIGWRNFQIRWIQSISGQIIKRIIESGHCLNHQIINWIYIQFWQDHILNWVKSDPLTVI